MRARRPGPNRITRAALVVALTGGAAAAAPGAATATVPLVPTAVSPGGDRIDIEGPVPGTTTMDGAFVRMMELTDGGLYFTQPEVDGATRTETLWRQVLYRTADGYALGNPARIGTTLHPTVPDFVTFVADENSVMWEDRDAQGQWMERLWDGGVTAPRERVPYGLAGFSPLAWGGGWIIEGDWMRPLRPTSGLPHGIDLAGLGESFDAAYVQGAGMSDSTVGWIDYYRETPDSGTGLRLVAHDFDVDGLVGDPVVLEDNPAVWVGGVAQPGPFPSGPVQVSNTHLAWLSTEEHRLASTGTLRWVTTDALTDAPQEYAGSATEPLAADGDRIAFREVLNPGAPDELTTIVVLNLTTGAQEAVVPLDTSLVGLALHGDLLAWFDYDKGLHIQSVSGATTLTRVGAYSDVARDNPFEQHIDELTATGIVTGYPGATFRPLAPVTREAMAAFLYRLAGSPDATVPAVSPFTDVSSGHPFYSAICWLAQEGISTGWPAADGTASFRPGQPVSREAMAAFLHRMAGVPAATAAPVFVDVTAQHPFAEAITWLAEAGVSTGWSTDAGAQFRPAAAVERQAMAAFLVRYAHLD